MLRRLIFSFVFLFGFVAFAQQNNDVGEDVHGLINLQVLQPIKKLHDPASVDMFSRAFIGSVWKYDLVSKPSKQQGFYLFMLREYRGAFVIDQYKMRVYSDKKKVALEDWQNKTYLDAPKWVEFYKDQKGKK